MDCAFRAGQAHYIHQQIPQQLETMSWIRAYSLGPMVGPCAFSSLAIMPSWLNSEEGRAFCGLMPARGDIYQQHLLKI